MRMTYVIHIAAGSLSLVAGYVACTPPRRSAASPSGDAIVYACSRCVSWRDDRGTRSVVPAWNVR